MSSHGSDEFMLKGAGNANLVFSYNGPDTQLAGTVVRVRKRLGLSDDKPSQISLDDVINSQLWNNIIGVKDSDSPIVREEQYIQKYLTRWLDTRYLPQGVPCDISQGAYVTLRTALEQHTDVLDPSVQPQVFMDHTLLQTRPPAGWSFAGPSICAEIKPKSGAMPSLDHVQQDNKDLKAQYPRYVMHALLKACKGHGELSLYNPQDLFSGDKQRLRAAIKSLLAAPNNNLRLFLEGAQVYGEAATAKVKGNTHLKSGNPCHEPSLMTAGQEQQRLATLEQELLQSGLILSRGSTAGRTPAAGAGVVSSAAQALKVTDGIDTALVPIVIDALQEVLHQEGLLGQLLAVQQQDNIDIEGACSAYHALHQYLTTIHQRTTNTAMQNSMASMQDASSSTEAGTCQADAHARPPGLQVWQSEPTPLVITSPVGQHCAVHGIMGTELGQIQEDVASLTISGNGTTTAADEALGPQDNTEQGKHTGGDEGGTCGDMTYTRCLSTPHAYSSPVAGDASNNSKTQQATCTAQSTLVTGTVALPDTAQEGSAVGIAPTAAECVVIWNGKTLEQVYELLRGYLVAITAKDCGMMMTLRQVIPSPHDHEDNPSATHEQSVSADKDTSASVDGVASMNDGVAGMKGEPDGAPGAAQPSSSSRTLLSAAARLKSIVRRNGGIISVPCKEAPSSQLHFMYKITLLDLDLKDVRKIPKHMEQDQEILNIASQYRDLLQQWKAANSSMH